MGAIRLNVGINSQTTERVKFQDKKGKGLIKRDRQEDKHKRKSQNEKLKRKVNQKQDPKTILLNLNLEVKILVRKLSLTPFIY